MSVEAGKRERERIEGSDERVKSERDSEERVVKVCSLRERERRRERECVCA